MKLFSLLLAAVALSACTAQPIFSGGNSVSDPAEAVPTRYTSVIGEIPDAQPVEPGVWAERNADVAPDAAAAK